MLYLDEKSETSKMKLQNHEGGLLIESGPPGRDSKQQYSEHQADLIASWMTTSFECSICDEPGIYSSSCICCRKHRLMCFEHRRKWATTCPECGSPLQPMVYHRIVN